MKYNTKTIITVILRASALYLMFYAAAALNALVLSFSFFLDLTLGGSFSERAQQIVGVFPLLLVFYSFTRVFALHNSAARAKVLAQSEWKTLVQGRRFLKSAEFWGELLCVFAWILILPTPRPLAELLQNANTSAFSQRLFSLAIMLPAAFLLYTICQLMVQKFWYKKRSAFESLEIKWYNDLRGIITQLITQTLIFCALFYIFPPLSALFIIIAQFFSYFALPIAAIVLPIVLLYNAILYIRAFSKRRAFIRVLRKSCEANAFTLSPIRTPYKSLFSLEQGYDFSVTAHGKIYDCKLLAGVKPGSPMVFSPTGGLLITPIKFLKFEWYKFIQKFDYRFDGDNKKLLIISPIPTALYENKYIPESEMEAGGTVCGYKILNATGFIGALERDTLER